MNFKELYDEVKRISPKDEFITVGVTARRYSTGDESLEWEIYTSDGNLSFFKANTPEAALTLFRVHAERNKPVADGLFAATSVLPDLTKPTPEPVTAEAGNPDPLPEISTPKPEPVAADPGNEPPF